MKNNRSKEWFEFPGYYGLMRRAWYRSQWVGRLILRWPLRTIDDEQRRQILLWLEL
jgi:hypothetical protein